MKKSTFFCTFFLTCVCLFTSVNTVKADCFDGHVPIGSKCETPPGGGGLAADNSDLTGKVSETDLTLETLIGWFIRFGL